MSVQLHDRIRWFVEARFGIFLHWGPYAVLRRGEWVMCRERFSVDDYERLADEFHAEQYDPDAWVQAAKNAGMGYLVLTTKHHDGFCLFETATTNFNAVQRGPRRDLIAEYVDACRRHDMRIGFYFSLLDWHHPDWAAHYAWKDLPEWSTPIPDAHAMGRYVEYQHAQVRELMSQYGHIDILWYDGGFLPPAVLRSAELNAMARGLQPDMLINDRSGLPEDFATPEGRTPVIPPPRPWELCASTHIGWGIEADDPAIYRPVPELLATLCDCAAHGGNLLLNVGPQADGRFPAIVTEQLLEIGDWMEDNAGAITGTSPGPFGRQAWGESTAKPGKVYLHVFRPENTLVVHGFNTTVQRAGVLATGDALTFNTAGNSLTVDMPPSDEYAVVVELDVEGDVQASVPAIRQDADGRCFLTANHATILAPHDRDTVDLYIHPDALGGMLCFWSRVDEFPQWQFTLDRPGAYRVLVEYANVDECAGAPYTVLVGDQLLCGIAERSGSWFRFRTDEVGEFTLAAGEHNLILQPVEVTTGGVMGLRAVILQPC